MVEEPLGFAQEGPGGRRAAQTWNEEPRLAGKVGGNGLASESRAGRCLANSMHATGVEASAAGSAASTSGASWYTHATREAQGAGLSYLSTCGLVLYGQDGARESRAWSHV